MTGRWLKKQPLFLCCPKTKRKEGYMTKRSITCEIARPIAVLSENERGYTKEINLVSWNRADPKYDIRNWHPSREKCGKGITLNEEEAHALMDALREVFGEEE